VRYGSSVWLRQVMSRSAMFWQIRYVVSRSVGLSWVTADELRYVSYVRFRYGS